MSTSDLELLARYSRQGAEDAFAEIVRRHAGLVYTTALRVTHSSQLAEDVAQAVFLDLSRNAKKLSPDTVLAAWLYTVTRRIAANTVRGETRRLIREQAAYAMNAAEESSPPPAELEPLLDDAMDSLAETDRAAIVLRFFEDKSLADVGKALGVSADAAQKRVSRAVEQMRSFFTQRGIATGTVAVTALLAANTAKAVPVGLAASICASVHSAGIPLTTATLIKTATMTTIQKSLVGLTVVAAIGVAVRQTHEVTQLREQLKTSQSSAHETPSMQSENADSTPGRTSIRKVTAKTATKPTSAQLEAQLLSLAEIGVGKFGRANMYQLIADAPVEDIPRLLAVVDAKMPGDLRQRFHEAWMERWAQADASAAFAYVASGDLKGPGLAIVLENWANQDPAAARKAVEACTSPGKDYIREELAKATLEKDPKGTLDWALTAFPETPDGPFGDIRGLARKWSEMNPTEAWKWALSLPDGTQKSNLMSTLAQGAAVASPVEVANEVAKMPPGKDQTLAATRVAASWANTDPRAASEWAAQFPDPKFRGYAMSAIAGQWVTQDPKAVRDWIQSLPPGDDQQQAMWGMTQTLLESNPEQVADIAPSLTDPWKRNQAIKAIGESMFRRDPSAARQWLQGQGVEEEKIQEFKEHSKYTRLPLGSPDR